MCLHFLPLSRNEVKISRIWTILSDADDIIWSPSLHSSNWGMKPWIQPIHTLVSAFSVRKSTDKDREHLWENVFDVYFELLCPIHYDEGTILQPATKGRSRHFGCHLYLQCMVFSIVYQTVEHFIPHINQHFQILFLAISSVVEAPQSLIWQHKCFNVALSNATCF